jgi:hypothetical protein
MFPNGAPQVLCRPYYEVEPPGATGYGFKRLNFKNLDPASVRSEVFIKKTPFKFSSIPELPSGPLIDPYYVWNKVLLAYTRGALTKQSDKLVAISAVAKQIQGMTKDRYLAGMWRRYLEYHLLWLADQGDRERARTKKEYVAPSWSWASMTCAIQPFLYIRPNIATSIQILDVVVENVTSDMMGQVSSGFLKLQGWLKKVPMKEDKSWTIQFDKPQICDTAQFDEDCDYENYRGREVWYLPVVIIGPWIACEAYGLILEETGKEDEFRRIGRFSAGEGTARAFRRPAYPIKGNGILTGGQGMNEEGAGVQDMNEEGAGVQGVSNQSGDTGSQKSGKRWGFGMRKKTDETAVWKERVITII